MYRQSQPISPYVIVTLGSVVVAMDRHTGRRVWEWRLLSDGALTRAHVTDQRVIVGGMKHLACLAYATGLQLWSVDSPVYVSTWLFDEGQLFVSGSGEVACFDAESGRLLWHDGFGGYGHWGSVLGVPGNVCQVDHNS